ncbi:MAG: glycosyltransferase family 4 protein [Solirubrobacteraceae bacterium]|jgi:glycosyltransferase involved in cell wall biosynthesis
MPARSLHIAWLGAGPGVKETGGVPGVATELLCGLASLGHRIDCFFPGTGHTIRERLADEENLTFFWGTSNWRWHRWYNRSKLGVLMTGLFSRGLASLRLRQEVLRRHRQDPYDVIYQFSNIETLAMPSDLRHKVPLVIHPETHIAGELRFLIAERRLALRCQPAYIFAIAVTMMSLRARVQRVRIRRARLLICISSVFRDHLVRDYGFPREGTIVVPNPVRLSPFTDADTDRGLGAPPVLVVLGRIAVRKGVEDVVALAAALLERKVDVRIRVVGGPSLWSDYTPLLEDLPGENAEYVGRLPPAQIPAELASSDILLQVSRYEPFALTVGEALASGVPVVATSEVGAVEGVDSTVAATVKPGDIDAMCEAIVTMIDRLKKSPQAIRSTARAEAERLFAPDLVCRRISDALERLLEGEKELAASDHRMTAEPDHAALS